MEAAVTAILPGGFGAGTGRSAQATGILAGGGVEEMGMAWP